MKRRQPYSKPVDLEYDFVVVGSGPLIFHVAIGFSGSICGHPVFSVTVSSVFFY